MEGPASKACRVVGPTLGLLDYFLNCKGVRSGRVGHIIEASCHVADLHVSTLGWLMLVSSNHKIFFFNSRTAYGHISIL